MSSFIAITHLNHVTSLDASSRTPPYQKLIKTLADSPRYDGKLFLGFPGIFFSSGFFNGDIPNQSPYPRSLANGTVVRRVHVPLKLLNLHKYKMIDYSPPRNQNTCIAFVPPDSPADKLLQLMKKEGSNAGEYGFEYLDIYHNNFMIYDDQHGWKIRNNWITVLLGDFCNFEDKSVYEMSGGNSATLQLLNERADQVVWDYVTKKQEKQKETNAPQETWETIWAEDAKRRPKSSQVETERLKARCEATLETLQETGLLEELANTEPVKSVIEEVEQISNSMADPESTWEKVKQLRSFAKEKRKLEMLHVPKNKKQRTTAATSTQATTQSSPKKK